MNVNDEVYGDFAVDEPVLSELMASAPLQRIKRISQHGLPKEIVEKDRYYYPRYDHCVGAMLLLRKLGASLEEQVAGLLHDVSHTPFSHTIDMVLGTYDRQNYQDIRHREFIMASEIPDILQKHGLDPERAADIESYGLLERELPDICADRLDYTFRDCYYGGKREALRSMGGLTVRDDEIVFGDTGDAALFTRYYAECSEDFWASTKQTAKIHALADVIRESMKAGELSMEDVTNYDDEHVMAKLRASGIYRVKAVVRDLEQDSLAIREEKDGPIFLRPKVRYVDPKVADGSGTHRLSELDEGSGRLIAHMREFAKGGVRVSIMYHGENGDAAL